jgi:hypothetical protein
MTAPPTEDKPAVSPFDILTTACHYLALKPRERSVLRDCMWARTQVANGHFLTASVRSAERLIARGYLTRAASQPVPFDPKFGLVVLLEQDNFNKLVEDARAAAVRLNPAAEPDRP